MENTIYFMFLILTGVVLGLIIILSGVKQSQKNEMRKAMSKNNFSELTVKPEGRRMLDQAFPISPTNKHLLGKIIKTAAKDALANDAVRQVVLELEPGEYGKKGGKVINYYVTPEFAGKFLSEEEIEKIKRTSHE